MRDLGRDHRRIHERWRERAAQKLPDLVAACEQRLDALADVLDRSDRVERRKLRPLARPIRQRRRIERSAHRGEEQDCSDARADLEAAVGNVTVRDPIADQVEEQSERQRAEPRTDE